MNPSPVRREVAATLKLAAPLVGAQLAQMSMSFVDVVMVGRLGTSALAAAVLGSTAFFTLALICIGVILAVNPTVAQAVGAGDDELAARATRQGLWLALILGTPLFIALGWAEEGLVALGQAPDTAALAGEYLGAIRWGIVPNLAFTAFRGFYEGTGRARPVLLATLVGVAVNIAANDVLMYGRFGLPALGLEGTGWSSALVFTAMAASLALGLRLSPTLRRYGVLAGLRTPDRAMLGTLVRLGLPIGATFGLEAGLFSAATLLVGWLGETPLAAHQIALNAASFTFMVPLGIGMAATVRVGQRIGAETPLAPAGPGSWPSRWGPPSWPAPRRFSGSGPDGSSFSTRAPRQRPSWRRSRRRCSGSRPCFNSWTASRRPPLARFGG